MNDFLVSPTIGILEKSIPVVTQQQNNDVSIALISAFIGAFLGWLLTAFWDWYKNHLKYKELVHLTLNELEQNLERINLAQSTLPEHVINKKSHSDFLKLTEKEIESLPWTFPKPYITEAWKTFVLSGLTIKLPAEIATKLYKLYDNIHSLNFLGNLSITLFQILSQQNRLDPQTNKNFDTFCKTGTIFPTIMMQKDTTEVIEILKNIQKN